MKIGLVDVDSHNFPNFALMRISAWHKAQGDEVEWAVPMFGDYDRVYQSKIFTFTLDVTDFDGKCEVIRGGTGYDVRSELPVQMECTTEMDYSIYPQYPFSVIFLSRGCIRKCPFCLVHNKEGYIHSVIPAQLNPNGKWIEVLDNNFFGHPQWHASVEYLMEVGQSINLHGVDIRIMDEEQAFYLNKLRLRKSIHIAWDLPEIDLTDKLKEVTKYIKPWKLMCYVLVGFNSSMEQDLYRIERLRELGIKPYVMPYRDFENKRVPTQYEKDLAQYVNKPIIFRSCTFEDFSPRKGFTCKQYFTSK